MFTFATRTHVSGVSARAAYDYLIVPIDGEFQTWWPGTHLVSKLLRQGVAADGRPSHVGTVIYLEQMIGRFRVRETAEIIAAEPGRKFVRQVLKGLPLPVFVTFELEDDVRGGTTITHTIDAGFRGLGRIFDPLFRVFFTSAFITALDEHLRIELTLLREVLGPKHAAPIPPRHVPRPTTEMPALDLAPLDVAALSITTTVTPE